ncbi:hypothetical protein [Hydrogenophaga intermedia]|uniref:Uncharacterized protein n=1 Tax=Hydrogenophaga intermedia TaxID=65786 RepID=A0A1L1PBW0_HYDIT|nr:hypothetical protein [Hydrogenophaga intermedia]TMU72424.1 hypothetical protein FGJ01_18795 [Hydrogenophaga intermedia]CDN87502.1 hypothetical protein BN948_01924 [Hydrogenophaga intermedia]
MKTTIKLTAGRALVVQPAPGKGVRVDVTLAGVVVAGDVLTPDQTGALLFGLEQAAEAAGIAADRVSEGIASALRIKAAPLAVVKRTACAASGCNYPEGECSGALGGCIGCRRAA